MIAPLKSKLLLEAKNIFGWKTNRKLIVFSVDDYGNVRLDSPIARANMDQAGMHIYSRFDALDTLETTEDLEALYEVLTSVKDSKGRSAVFTPYALPCNIDFETIASEGYKQYRYETLPITYDKLRAQQPKAYTGTWDLWKEGIDKGLMQPQFHGREHLNVRLFEEKLLAKDVHLLTALKNRSYTSIADEGYPTISAFAAFDFWDLSDNEGFKDIITDGLQKFEEVYGYRSDCFTPPVYSIHHSLFYLLKEKGIRTIDLGLINKEHQGLNAYKTEWNYTGKTKPAGLRAVVRNVVYEPTDPRGIDWEAFTMKQIEAAFRWNRPAVISSHRVNFCGHIDPKNRAEGLGSLKKLLTAIVTKWPEVEFISASELGKMIIKENK